MIQPTRYGVRADDPMLEQDDAAGGRDYRLIRHQTGKIVTGSIYLKVFRWGYQVYAYLRFRDGRETVTQYVGQVTRPTREEALRLAWTCARQSKRLKNDARWAVPKRS